jgi:hypothetical protein
LQCTRLCFQQTLLPTLSLGSRGDPLEVLENTFFRISGTRQDLPSPAPGVQRASLTQWPMLLAEHSLLMRCLDFPVTKHSLSLPERKAGCLAQSSRSLPPVPGGPLTPETDRQTHTHTHTHPYLRTEHNGFGCNGCPGEETIETGAWGDLDKSPPRPPPPPPQTPVTKHLPSTLQQGPW